MKEQKLYTNLELFKVALDKVRSKTFGVQGAITYALRGVTDKARRIYLRNVLTKRVNVALSKDRCISEKARAEKKFKMDVEQARINESRFHQQNNEGDIVS